MFKIGQIWTVQSQRTEDLVDKRWYNILITKIIDDPKEIEDYFGSEYHITEAPTCLVENHAYNVTTNRVYSRDRDSVWTDANIPDDITDTFSLNVLETFKRMKKINKDKK